MNIVVYVSHIDDEILGAGGLIPQIIAAGHKIDIVYATDGSSPREGTQNKKQYAKKGIEVLGVDPEQLHFLGFKELSFDEFPVIEFNRAFNRLGLNPDIIITNSKQDINQDHHHVFQSALVVGRSVEKQVGILSCEIVSSSEWGDEPFDPTFYVDISNTIDKKVAAMEAIEPELREWPHPRSPKGIRTKARQRGMEVGYDYAEAYRMVRWFDFDEPLCG